MADDSTTFVHLRAAGWAAMGPAIVASTNVQRFVTPDLMSGLIAPLLTTPATSSKLGHCVLAAMSEFIPADDPQALEAAAKLAVTTRTALPVAEISRVAAVCQNSGLTLQLLQVEPPAASDIVGVLNALGSSYSYLSTWEKDEFEVPYDDLHRTVFAILRDANICTFSKKPRKPWLVVRRP